MNTVIALFLLFLGHFLVDFMIGIWSVYKTMASVDLGIAGLMAALCSFTGEGAQLLFGNLSDRGHRKRLIAFGVVLTVANALLSFTGHYFGLFLLLLLTCIGSGAFHPTAVAYIGSLTTRQKSLFISIFASGGTLGMAVSQIIYSQVHSQWEGNTLILLVPSLLLVLLLCFLGFHKKEDLTRQGVHSMPFTLSVFRAYFRDPSLKMLYISQVCHQTILWATLFLLPDVLKSRGYEESITFGGGHLAFVIGGVFTLIPSGYLADRYSSRAVILYSTLVGVVLFYAFLMLPELSSNYLIPLLFVAGAVLAIAQPLSVALGNILGKKNPGMASAFTMGLVWVISESLGPAGGGFLSKLFTEDAPAKALMVIGCLFFVMIYAVYRLPEKEPEAIKI